MTNRCIQKLQFLKKIICEFNRVVNCYKTCFEKLKNALQFSLQQIAMHIADIVIIVSTIK